MTRFSKASRFQAGHVLHSPVQKDSESNAVGNATLPKMSMSLSPDIRRYARKLDELSGAASWQGLPEFPAASEILDLGRKAHEEALELDNNVVVGPCPSKDDYLSRHYSLLREDAVAPLRDAVDEVQAQPYMVESASQGDSYIYEKVNFASARSVPTYLDLVDRSTSPDTHSLILGLPLRSHSLLDELVARYDGSRARGYEQVLWLR